MQEQTRDRDAQTGVHREEPPCPFDHAQAGWISTRRDCSCSSIQVSGNIMIGCLFLFLKGLFFLIIFVLLGVFLGFFGLVLWFNDSLPKTDGHILVEGLQDEIEILRDDWGIPHIFAQSPSDAYFGLGFVHAQDRMFQMEQQRRLAQGRLSEVVGPLAVDIDKFMRLLDLHRSASASYAIMNAHARETLDAYAAGVNQFLETHNGSLSPEFTLLLADDPENWKPADSVVWMKMMALLLSGNWRDEILHAQLIERLGPEKAASFFPGNPADQPAIIPSSDAAGLRKLGDLLAWLGPSTDNGSNNWAVDGRFTSTGHPLLANDPHLRFAIPSAWYLAHLEAPSLTVMGATLPGMPVFAVATNGEIAWSLSNTGPDTQDVFIETVDPENPARYMTPNGSEPFAVRDERIVVRFAPDKSVRMRETRHGPVLSDFVVEWSDEAERVAALAWTILHDDDLSVQAALELHTATSWNDLLAFTRAFTGPVQNIVYADRLGNIGLLVPGVIPVRRDGRGLVPVDGSGDAFDWTGRIPHGEMPTLLNPRSGIVAAANDRLVDDSYPYFLGQQWAPGFRGKRIRERLQEQATHDVGSFASIQMDLHDGFAVAMLPLALGAEPDTPGGRLLQARLQEWDGTMHPELVAPTVFHAWYREFTRLVYSDDLGDLFDEAWSRRPLFALTLIENDPHGWCLNATLPAVKSCQGLAGIAFDHASTFLVSRFGEDRGNWSWGDVHALDLSHTIFGMIPVLDSLTDVRIEIGGSRHTVAQASYVFDNDDSVFSAVHGAGLRAIVELNDPVSGHFVILPGQSGNPFSPHYQSMVERWISNQPIRLEFGRNNVNAAARLILAPKET